MDGMTLDAEALVTEHVSEPMLGIDWLKQHGCQMDFRRDAAIIGGRVYQLTSKEIQGMCRRIVAVRAEVIPAWSQGTVEGRVELSSLQDLGAREWCTEVGEVRPGLCVARTLVPDRLESVPVLLMNVTSQMIRVDARCELSGLLPVDAMSSMDPPESDTLVARAIECVEH